MEIKNNVLRKLVENRLGDLNAQKLLGTSGTQSQSDNTQLSQFDMDILKRGLCRRVSTIISEQQNWEDVVHRTDVILQDEDNNSYPQDVNHVETDQGWIDDCMEGASKTYNDDLKQYFAKLLAGEIKNPGRYSKRAIQFLRSISQNDAVKIRNMCQYVMYSYSHDDAIILRYKKSEYSYNETSFLMELRLIDSSSFVVKQYRSQEDNNQGFFIHGNVGFFMNIKKKEYDLPIYSFTELGKEILSIIDNVDVNLDYLKNFSKSITEGKKDIEIVGGEFFMEGETLHFCKNEKYFEVPEKINSNDSAAAK